MSDNLYRCGCATIAPSLPGKIKSQVGAIDVHCHLAIPEVDKLASQDPAAKVVAAKQQAVFSQATNEFNATLLQGLIPRLINIDTRLADMDLMGVEIQVLSPSPMHYNYWTNAELSASLVALQNDRLAEICVKHPDRFLAFGALSMQYPEQAALQLTDLMSRGFKGVEISTRINETDLSDPLFDCVWEVAERTGAVIFIHPMGIDMGDRLKDSYLVNLIGQPLETTIALSKLIFSGVFDRFPALKVLLCHGGGYLPAFFGRSDHAYNVRTDCQTMQKQPSDYLKHIWYDTITHDPTILEQLARTVGVSQIVVGSDYPFDMGEFRQGPLLESVASFSDDDRAAIIYKNARRLLSLEAAS